MRLIKYILIILFLNSCDHNEQMLNENKKNTKTTCNVTDIFELKNSYARISFIDELNKTLKKQYPSKEKEKGILVDINEKLLKEFIDSIDKKELISKNKFEKEFFFNIAPNGFIDNPKCGDKISIIFDNDKCLYRMIIHNSFMIDNNNCSEANVIYYFRIIKHKIIDFERNANG